MTTDGNAALQNHSDNAFLLDVLFSHKLAWIRGLLKDKGLPQSGTAEDLRERISVYLKTSRLDTADLVNLLDQVEGWGDQHVYFYNATKLLIAALANELAFRERLKDNRVARLFNKRLPLVLPGTPTLSAVDWSESRVRLTWVEKRVYRDRIEDEDREEGSLEFDAYELKQTRGIVSFSCDLVTGEAELLIQRLPSGNNYSAEKVRYEALMSTFLDVGQLSSRPINSAIKKIDSVKAIRKRSSEWATLSGDRVKFTSRSRKSDAYKDPAIRKSRNELRNVAGRLGNYYWPILGRDIHITLYAKDQRIGIFGECTQAEVANALTEVRNYC